MYSGQGLGGVCILVCVHVKCLHCPLTTKLWWSPYVRTLSTCISCVKDPVYFHTCMQSTLCMVYVNMLPSGLDCATVLCVRVYALNGRQASHTKKLRHALIVPVEFVITA